MQVSMNLNADRTTDNKCRWDFHPDGDSAVFSLYVPKWRVPEPWPKFILVEFYPSDEFIPPPDQVSGRMVMNDPSVRQRSIAALIERKAEHLHSVQFRPVGPKDEWEIGEPYIPRSLLPTDSPQMFRFRVDWQGQSSGTTTPSNYDEHALAEIHAWKNPELGWFGQAMALLNWPVDKAGDLLLATPGIGDVLKKTVEGITSVCNDVAQWSVSPDGICGEFQKSGHQNVRSIDDIHALELKQIDKVVGWLDAKYKGIALVEGASLGALGPWGIAPDVAALITLNLRAIGEYATYYGFDISLQRERLFALNILGLSSSTTAAGKTLAMAQLVRIAQDTAKKKTWKQLEQHLFVQVIQEISKALGIRLTKEKLAQVLPVAGAVVGGGFNAYFTSNVCQAAYYLYRERYLAEKYGPGVIVETVPPAEDVDPHYPEETERGLLGFEPPEPSKDDKEPLDKWDDVDDGK
jgi:hypothetical protein